MRKAWRWLIHPIVRWYALKVLYKHTGLFTYPIFVELEFNKELYYQKFMIGESYKSIVTQLMEEKSNALVKGLVNIGRQKFRREKRSTLPKKEYIELIRRYQGYSDRIIDRAKKEAFNREFDEYEKDYQDHLKHKS